MLSFTGEFASCCHKIFFSFIRTLASILPLFTSTVKGFARSTYDKLKALNFIVKEWGATTKASKGFTIVELLIVVVVIAILAAIITVSYNGITSRASASKTLTLVRQWTQPIEAYRSLNNVLPNDWTCLGNAVTDFPTELGEGIGPGQCERNFIVVGQPSDWTSEFKTNPTAGQTLSTADMLRANSSLPGRMYLLYPKRAGVCDGRDAPCTWLY